MFEFRNKFIGFLKRFSLWLGPHILAGLCVGAFFAVELNGAEGADKYYTPLLIASAIAAVCAFVAYFSFGCRDERYNSENLSSFDKLMIKRYGSKYSRMLSRAVIDMHLFDFNSALDSFEELAEKALSDNQRAVLSFYTGRCYQLMGYPANGVKYFQKALELGLDINDTYLLAARCLVQNGRYDDAVDYYNILVERECRFDFIYTDIGIAYLKKGDSEKALEAFNKSIDEGRNYAFALGGCALAYLLMKDVEKSREYYKNAFRCNMDDVIGFKIFYCNIAESVGLLDEIDENMKKHSAAADEIIR